MGEVKNVAVVEIGGSHDECLLSQFFALKQAGCRIHFVGTEELWQRNQSFYSLVDTFVPIKVGQGSIADFMTMRRLNGYFNAHHIEKVILNTAQGGHVRNLCLTAKKSTEFIGIIHTLRKFNGSFTQKVISRKVKKYFVLNTFFLEHIPPQKGIRLEAFYPLRFPTFEQSSRETNTFTQIAVIGGVENRRKDLFGSLTLIESISDLNIRIVFLGKSDPSKEEVIAFKKALEEKGWQEKVILFDEFVDAQRFDEVLTSTDFIWPMVHPETDSAKEYFRNQIPGALNVSLGYKIPLFVHRAYASSWSDLHTAATYALETFCEDLEKAIDNHQTLRDDLVQNPKYSVAYQEENYVKFIFDTATKKS
jgi:hypothetical protein